MANEQRGEADFKVGDISFTARPTFALIAAIEAEIGVSIMVLAGKLRAGTLSFSDLVIVAALAAKHAPDKPAGADDQAAFREKVFEAGPLNFFAPVSTLLMNTITTGKPEKKDGGGTAEKKN